MDQDAEVINLLVMTTLSYADPAFVPGWTMIQSAVKRAETMKVIRMSTA